jgi:hypothetical protein
LSIASNIQWYALIPHKAYSFITTLFLGPFDDVITKFYCINVKVWCDSVTNEALRDLYVFPDVIRSLNQGRYDGLDTWFG